MRAIVFFFIFCLPIPLKGYFHFQELREQMSQEEWAASGLKKLTPEEKRYFETWLVRKHHRYHFSTPILNNKKKLEWVYVAKKRKAYRSTFDPAIYDEKKIPHDLAVFSLFQHESKYLREWIEYHLMLGVQHFYLYNNVSSDNYLKVLAPYIRQGIVTLVQWPYYDPDGAAPYFWCEMQKRTYENALMRARGKYRWMAFIDTDEFLVPVEKDSLIDFLADYEDYGGVAINWMIYGTSYVNKIAPDELMIERLVQRFPLEHGENKKFKSIVKPHRVKYWPNPHWCSYQKGFFAVDPTKRRAPYKSQHNQFQPIDEIRINHYWFREADFYWKVKVPRWRTTAWQLTDKAFKRRERRGNKVHDPIIQRFVPKLKERMKLRKRNENK